MTYKELQTQQRNELVKWNNTEPKDFDALAEITTRHSNEITKRIKEDETGNGFVYEMFLDLLLPFEQDFDEYIEDYLDVMDYSPKQIRRNKKLSIGLNKAIREVFDRCAKKY